MPKKIRDGLSEDQKNERISTMVVLNLNLSLCHLKRGVAHDAIKHAKDAVELDPENSKAHFRLAMAHKLNNDLDPAKEHLATAVKLEPGDRSLRKEYESLMELKSKKEKEWYSKMSGFFDSKKLKDIEKKDEVQEKLRFKIKRQTFRQQEKPRPNHERFV
jgi:tetratricopeptide (TPR) repeat protein